MKISTKNLGGNPVTATYTSPSSLQFQSYNFDISEAKALPTGAAICPLLTHGIHCPVSWPLSTTREDERGILPAIDEHNILHHVCPAQVS